MPNPNPTVTIKGRNTSAQAFRQARSDMDKLKAGAKAAGLALAGLAAAGAAVVSRTVEQTRGVRAYSEALGVSTENLSRWGFAAESVGLSAEKVADIMKDSADKIGDAYRNNSGEAKDAIISLGLDLQQLAAMSPDQQLLTIAKALEGVKTQAEKVQILESIGNDLTVMLPLLENNAEGLRKMGERADQLGVTLTSIEAENIDKADEAIRDLKGSFDAMGQTLTAFVGPALADWLEDIRVNLPTWVRYAEDAVLDFGAAVMAAWEAMNPSDITGATSFGDALVENQIMLRKMRSEIRATEKERPITIYGAEAEQAGIDALDKQNELRRAELDAQYQFEDERTRRAQSGERARLTFSTWTAKEQTKHVVGEALALTRGVAGQSKALFEINKVAGIANAVINTHEGITKSLAAYPWPLAGAMAALHAASGLAQVAAIKSASFGGGGGTASPGGGNGPVATPPSDFATAPITNEPRGATVQITVQGNVLANDDWRAAMVEQIETAIDNDELRIR